MTEIEETGPSAVERRALSTCLLIALAVIGGSIQLLWLGFLVWMVVRVPLSMGAHAIFHTS